ncbi:hypothetical protein ACVRYP_07140 [Streptococcus rifensis]
MQEISVEFAIAIYILLAPLAIYLWLRPGEQIKASKELEKTPEVPMVTPWIIHSFLR